VPSYIKVSGTPRTVIAPSVKIGSTWHQAIFIYTKVNGTWRQGFAANVEDTFNRADQTGLGTTSNFVTTWTAQRQVWNIVSNQATTAADPTTYPLATVASPRQITDYELHIDNINGAGTGVAFWVTDLNNWWGAVTNTVSSVTYACPQGGVLSNTTCNRDDSYPAVTHPGGTNYSAASYNGGGYPNYGACSNTVVTINKPRAYYTYTGQPTTTSAYYVPSSVIACALTHHDATSTQYSCPDGSNRASYSVTSQGSSTSFYTTSCSNCVAPTGGSKSCFYIAQATYNCILTYPATTNTVYCTVVSYGTAAYNSCEGPSVRGYACSGSPCREVQTYYPATTTCASGSYYGAGVLTDYPAAGCYTYTPSACPSGYTDLGSGYCQAGVPNYCANGSCTTSDASGYCQGNYVAPSCTCPSGGSPVGWDGSTPSTCTTCAANYGPYLYCPNGGSLAGSTCQLTTTYAATGTFTYTNQVKLLRSISSTVSTVQTYVAGASTSTSTDPAYTFTNDTRIKSLKVVTSNNTVAVTAYQNAGQTGTNNAYSYTATSPTKTMYAGILKAPADYVQGSTVDNFLLK
jgi:hypothetical protein